MTRLLRSMPSSSPYAAYCMQMMQAKFQRLITEIGKEKVVAFVGYEEGSNYQRVTRVITT